MYDVADICRHIAGLDLNDRRIAGSQLSALIRVKFPAFKPQDFTCRNLREFLARYVPSFKAIGQSGMDVIYQRVDETNGENASLVPGDSLPGSESATETEIWKTFVSPNPSFHLYAHPLTGQMRVQLPEVPSPSGWVHVPSCTSEKHREIAEQFISNLGDEALREQMRRSFDQPRWWEDLYDVIVKSGLGPSWNDFRRRRLIEELEATLAKLNIPPTRVPRSAPRTLPSQRTETTRSSLEPVRGRHDILRLRNIAGRVVSRMSAEEILALPVRIGLLLDALDH